MNMVFSNLSNLGTGVWGKRSSSPGVTMSSVILLIVPAQGGPFMEEVALMLPGGLRFGET